MKSPAREGDSEAGGMAVAPVTTTVSTAPSAVIALLSGRAAPSVLVSMPTDLTARN
ncbi:hypothetical protein GCM10010340_32500 [Streptomyces griseoloalbus]|nr:hypothetical protein GCM10010294_13130 [Streptomyces griseoloalbus]GGW51560.1 hypothetical protein GCM10010340_32500 [Streptomyces albaduncus]